MNAEDNAANCWKKAITIIRCILVVSVLKTTTSRNNISSGSCLLRTKIKQGLPRFIASAINRAGSTSRNTGLKVISAHRKSPANRASPAHIIRPLLQIAREKSFDYLLLSIHAAK